MTALHKQLNPKSHIADDLASNWGREPVQKPMHLARSSPIDQRRGLLKGAVAKITEVGFLRVRMREKGNRQLPLALMAREQCASEVQRNLQATWAVHTRDLLSTSRASCRGEKVERLQ